MPVTLPSKPIIAKTQPSSLDLGQLCAEIRNSPKAQQFISDALKKIQASVNSIERQIKDVSDNTFPEITVRGARGVVARIGSFGGTDGIAAIREWIGGDIKDPVHTAPFFVDDDGQVVIGKNGSVQVQDPLGGDIGFIGVVEEAAKTVVSLTAGPPCTLTVTAHGYSNGDIVLVQGVGAPADGYRLVAYVFPSDPDTFSIRNLNGTDITGPAYTSGGTVTRVFQGAHFEQFRAGGTQDVPNFVIGADGSVRVYNRDDGMRVVYGLGAFEDIYAEVLPDGITLRASGNSEAALTYDNNGGLVIVYDASGAEVGKFRVDSGGNAWLDAYAVNITRLYASGLNPRIDGSTAGFDIYKVGSATTGTTVIDSSRNVSANGVSASTYSAAGSPGIDLTQSFVTAVNFTTSAAITSVNFTAQTTTSANFVDGIGVVVRPSAWKKGILTT